MLQSPSCRYIKKPTLQDPLYRLAESPLAEEQPELHPVFQAATRLGEPCVDVLFIIVDDSDYMILSEGKKIILSPNTVPNWKLIPTILANTAKMPYRIFYNRDDCHCPKAWHCISLFRNLYIIKLSDCKAVDFDNPAISINPETGIIVEYFRREA